jgi:hypothetical protein
LRINDAPRRHVVDPKLGVAVDVDRAGTPPNRLVTLGDSITQGFMSAAVYRTDRSWPAVVAHELGLVPQQGFRYPAYEPTSGPGGLPIDLERAVRNLGRVIGDRLDWHEVVKAARWVRGYMDRIEDYWEGRGDDPFVLTAPASPYHNLAVYGADLVDVQVLNRRIIDARLRDRPHDDLVKQVVEHANDRAWQVVLAGCRGPNATVLDAAEQLGDEGAGPHGIETLVVMLGSNNALGSVVTLDPRWTTDEYGRLGSLDDRLDAKGDFNVWQPTHFAHEWARLVDRIKQIRARHVIIATVPQVTIAPIARGVYGKSRHGSRFFPYYTRPWITDEDFDSGRDPSINEAEARAIDSAIDAFNKTIIDSVRAIRKDPNDPRDWYLFDLGALLDRMAFKRYLTDPETQPSWWTPYPLPHAVAALRPPLDTRFFAADSGGRRQGGLFSLDGVHPTTISAGVIAHEVIRIMDRSAGVTFFDRAGRPRRQGEVAVDFERVIALDTLNSDPPSNVSSTMSLLGWFDEKVDWLRGVV